MAPAAHRSGREPEHDSPLRRRRTTQPGTEVEAVLASHLAMETGEESGDSASSGRSSPASSTVWLEGEPLRRAMATHVAAFDTPGHYLRVPLLFRSPFFNALLPDSWFMVDSFGGACVYDESARYDARGHGVLGFLLAGNGALDLMNGHDATLASRVIEALPAALRTPAFEQLMEVRVHRWCAGISGQPGDWQPRDARLTHEPDCERDSCASATTCSTRPSMACTGRPTSPPRCWAHI